MTPEQLELAITHYLDGTLPPEEISALEQTLARDAAAQAMLGEHEKLTALLRSNPLPEMDWAELAQDLSACITGNVDEQSRAGDQKLNVILAAATPLPDIRWESFAGRIMQAIDAEVAATDAADERLDELLQTAPMPAVNWDRLASHLSNAVAAEVASATPVADEARPAVIGRIGFGRTVRRMAIAASLLLATTLGLHLATTNRGGSDGVANPGQAPGPVAVNVPKIFIEAPTVEAATQPAVAEISIGPSAAYAANVDDDAYRYTNSSNRSPIVIALPVRAEEEADRTSDFD